MYRYAQIDISTGIVVGDSYLSGEVELENMIPISDGFDLKNKTNSAEIKLMTKPI